MFESVRSTCQKAGQLGAVLSLDMDTQVSKESYDASLHCVGGAFKAVDEIMTGHLNSAFVLGRPPGHHSNRDRARGFCLFNTVPLTVEFLVRTHNAKRVAVLDFDVHAGNGTMELLWDGPSQGECVFISVHRDPRYYYPGTGFVEQIGEGKQRGRIINCPLPEGSPDQALEMALDEVVAPVFNQFRPDFIVMSAGYDAHHADPLGGFNYTYNGYNTVIERVMTLADAHADGRILLNLEGGYNTTALAEAITNQVRILAGLGASYEEDPIAANPRFLEGVRSGPIAAVKERLGQFWRF
jgi:acetoin utilization deacetylase AcuC-like enzyme